MAFAKRIFLFVLLNFLVIFMISVVLRLLNIQPYLNSYGLDYNSLLTFCFVWGMAGALISLALSKVMAKWMMGVQVIDPDTRDPELRQLVDTVYRLAEDAGLPHPEVGIFRSNEVNAFATGPTRSRSLVAVSTGLLNRMKQSEIRAVLGHEVSHIANGDMVTMALLQGVVNAFVMFLARVLAYIFSGMGRSRENNSGGSWMSYMLFTYLFEIVFMLLGSLVVAAYSRFREFRADAGGARLAGKDSMISALQSLRVFQEIKDVKADNPAMAAFKISHPTKKGLLHLFATHPPLEERIERLKKHF
ncbi:MAG: protease HtpX [Verrucomicrobia bacterium]|nr:protease HtpX [Verrucomicrobiota bacterium]